MQHTAIYLPASNLSDPEWRIVQLLRAWKSAPDSQNAVWNDLCLTLGTARARSCLQAFEQMLALLHKHGWQTFRILPDGADGISPDELSLARFVMAATKQDRDTALAEATFLVSPNGLLPLVCAASRFGLPLLCEEYRKRLRAVTPVSRQN